MAEFIVAISIDKVQTFVFDAIYAYEQEKQSNNKTLSAVIKASNLISEDFYEQIGLENEKKGFSGHIKDNLLKCSGLCIFSTTLDEEIIQDKLKELFVYYYKTFNGKLLLKYTYFEKTIITDEDKLAAIGRSKQTLKNDSCVNEIIQCNKDLLFNFCTVNRSYLNPMSVAEKKYPLFAENINKLFKEDSTFKNNDNHFRIAVIKADFDGMGKWFEDIKDFATYQKVSDLLSKNFNINTLHRTARKIKYKNYKDNKDFTLYPIYIAGDDIFFAVPVSQLINGIKLCLDMLNKINDCLKNINESNEVSLDPLSISIGVDFTFNREPIRYYYERVQHQLDMAKKGKSFHSLDNSVQGLYYAKICINEYVFYNYKKEFKIIEEKEIAHWWHFIHNIKRLNYLILKLNSDNDEYKMHHFFYSLLDKLAQPEVENSDIKYSNAVLYHLLPKYLDSGNKALREAELLLLQALLEQFSEFKKSLRFGDDERRAFETYIKLMLLFSDPRFGIVKNTASKQQDVNNTNTDTTILEINAGNIDNIRSKIFNKPLRYIYDYNLDKLLESSAKKASIISLRKIFVKEVIYYSNNQRIQIYRTLRLSNSMLYRLKNTDKINIDMAAEMIKTVNYKSKEEIAKKENENNKQQKAPPGLHFNQEEFSQVADRSKLWTKDYIDSLIIFNQLNAMLIQFKLLYPSKKLKPSKGAKKCIITKSHSK